MKRPLLFGLAIVVIAVVVIMIGTTCNESYDNYRDNDSKVEIVHLVLFSDAFPYRQMMEITRPYYRTFQNVRTIYYCYDPKISCQFQYDAKEMILRIRGEETYVPGILNKTLDAIYFATEYFPAARTIVRSNASTVLNLSKMCEELNGSGCQIDYGGYGINELAWLDKAGGVIDETWFGTRYASGTCIILSMDLAYKMMKRRERFRKNLVDDLSIGVWMRENEPQVTIWSSKQTDWFYRNRKVNREDDLKEMKKIVETLQSDETKHTH